MTVFWVIEAMIVAGAPPVALPAHGRPGSAALPASFTLDDSLATSPPLRLSAPPHGGRHAPGMQRERDASVW